MTRQTNGIPELKYNEEIFRAMYEVLRATELLLQGYTSANDNPLLLTKIKQTLAKAEGKVE